MKPTIYTVQAYRWGIQSEYSYIVGVYPKKAAALKAAEIETQFRGGKYECEVREWNLGMESVNQAEPVGKIILPLKPKLR